MRYLDPMVNPDDTALAWLKTHLATADTFHAHIAYLDRRGVNTVLSELYDLLARGGQAHLVVDCRDGRPRHGDLAWLLEQIGPYGDRATVRLATDVAPLHAKVFYVRDASGDRRALVGSANFTGAGLTRNLEACIALDPEDTAALDGVEAAVKAWQEHPSTKPVDLGVIAAMERVGSDSPTGRAESFADLLTPTFDKIEKACEQPRGITGLPTGFTDLDRLLSGLGAGHLVLVAARTSLGKTTLVSDFMRSVSINHGIPSLMLSFEMPKDEIMQRFLSAEGRVPLHTLRSGQLTDDDWKKIAGRLGEISDAPLYVNDACSASIRNVAAEIRRAATEDGVRLVVVDFIQHLQADRRMDNRQQELTEIARTLKRLALELGITVVAVSQLNRGVEQRADRIPQLSDLRDSGALEEAADVVILLHRHDYYDRESPRAGEADLIVAKHRSGPTDTITVAAQLHLSRFMDMAIF